MQHRGAHLLPDALALMGPPEPRAGDDRAAPGELTRSQVLCADHRAAGEHREGDPPVVGRPFGTATPVPLEQAPLELAGWEIGPRMLEGHRRRIMDAARRERGQLDQIVVGRKPQLDTRRPQAQVEERPIRVRHVASDEAVDVGLLRAHRFGGSA
jgi:hypothetical protein